MTPARFAIAYAMDLLLGDPEWLPHPVRWFGRLIRFGERRLPSTELAGAALTCSLVTIAWGLGMPRYATWQVLLAWTTLATRSLLDEASSVIRALEAGDIQLARQRLSRIVGRDTAHLDESEISRAVIETLAESACDGIVAPMFWLAAGGVPAAMAHKAINTLDSMIGHFEPPYRDFGRVAARLDDVANYIPARLTALGIIAVAQRGYDAWRLDGAKHASPNAGQSEAAMAGALGVRLGGANSYDGEVNDAPILNAAARAPTVSDARKALRTVAIVSGLAFGVALLAMRRRR
jgi:adenosylcobinamide-phosphate synthase